MLPVAPRAKAGKQYDGAGEGRTLYQRMAVPVYEGFQRVNWNASHLLTSGL